MPPADHNQDGPSRDIFLRHVAIAIHDNQVRDQAKVTRSSNRKLAKLAEIDLGDMDQAIKMSDWSPSDIAKYFSRKFAYLGHMNVDPGTQFDLFGGVNPQVKEAPDFKAAGLYAGIKGLDGTPPQNLSGPEQQQWVAGWQEGQGHLAAGLELRAQNMAKAQGQAGKPAPAEKAKGPTADEEQQDLEQAIADGKVLELKLASFDCEAIGDCTQANYLGDGEAWENAFVVRVTDDAGEVRVLKDRGGRTETGFDDPKPDEAKPADPAPDEPKKRTRRLAVVK